MSQKKLNSFQELIRRLGDRFPKITGRSHPEITGGFLPCDAPNYVPRTADEQLYKFIQRTETRSRACHILAAPQMGKSSLIVRTIGRLSPDRYIWIFIQFDRPIAGITQPDFLRWFLQIVCDRINVSNKPAIPEMGTLVSEERFLEVNNFLKSVFRDVEAKDIIIFIDDIHQLIDREIQNFFIRLIGELSESKDESLQKLIFVISGIANPFDLLTSAGYNNKFVGIKLEPLTGDCQPLLAGLSTVSDRPSIVLNQILSWTRGQPFLTQILCELVTKQLKLKRDSNLKARIAALVKTEVIENRRIPVLVNHFKRIENWFVSGVPEKIDRTLYSLSLYRKILQYPQSCEFSDRSPGHQDLLISGLGAKFDSTIDVANPIYKQVFTAEWVEKTKQKVKQQRCFMPSPKIYNRDVYLLIDQSGSMVRRDPEFNNNIRWKALPEVLEGHVYRILEEKSMDGKKICDEVVITFFSPNRPCDKNIYIQDTSQVPGIFDENHPDSGTYIAPTLEQVINQWLAFGRANNRGAFIIIYTDGQFDDRDKFVNLIEKTCAKLKSQEELKIVIVGFGSEINPKFYLQLDMNASGFTDSKGESCNIVVFDLLNKMPSIIELLDRQLENPDAGLPTWAKDEYPELVS